MRWTFARPKRLGYGFAGLNGYQGVFRREEGSLFFVEHVVFFCVKPLPAMRTIGASDAPARFCNKHFDGGGQVIASKAPEPAHPQSGESKATFLPASDSSPL